MERALLRKVQLIELEIAKEIRRVCEENDIQYFLIGGSLLGAVRHQGFIPWDDDMDIGMVRSEYEKFARIAPQKLKPQYCFQNWYTDPNYGLPFGKVLKRGTVFRENKRTTRLLENGFYVDIFTYDNVPDDPFVREKLAKKMLTIYRTMLMKTGDAPWRDNGRIIWKKRLGYLYYQLRSLFVSQRELARAFDALAVGSGEGSMLCEQEAKAKPVYFRREVLETLTDHVFEGETFKIPKFYDEFLTLSYGDYMQLPPEDQRENRHQIVEIDFGQEEAGV